MPDIQRTHAPDNPLMQPAQYQGQEYFTSQYFYQQYRANSQHGAKYRWHQDFVRLMKSLEAYDIYVAQGDLHELRWIPQRKEGGYDPAYLQQIKTLENLFRAVGFQTIYLLNATAQAALSHHLDDELSKQMSVAINATVARQVTRRTADLLPSEMATRVLSARLDAGKLLGVPLHIAQQEAVKAVHVDTGIDYRPLLLSAPAQDNIPQAAKMLEPMDLANEFGWGRTTQSGFRMNKELETLGWQVRKVGGGWEATPAGEPHCFAHAYTADHGRREGYNYKWRIVDVQQALGLEARHG